MAKKIFSSTNILSASGEIGGSPHRRVGPLGMIAPPIMFAPLVMFVSLKRFFAKSFFWTIFFLLPIMFSKKQNLQQVKSISLFQQQRQNCILPVLLKKISVILCVLTQFPVFLHNFQCLHEDNISSNLTSKKYFFFFVKFFQ